MLNPLPLRDHARAWLAERIVLGQVVPGTRIGVGDIAGPLGISHTPAREALAQLECDGLLRVEPNRGFFVSDLDINEARDLYPIVWTLEALALRSRGACTSDEIDTLRDINASFQAESSDSERSLALDKEWHQALVGACSNSVLRAEIEKIRRRVLRYEHAFMRDSGRVPSSVQQHTEILDALRDSDTATAADLLETHWTSSLQFLVDWLGSCS